MPKDSKKSDKKYFKEDFDFDVDSNKDKKKCDKKTKEALKETLTILNDYVENTKKNKCPVRKEECCEKKEKKECCEKKDNKCCCEDCAECVVASRDACDAPEIDKLINTVYTVIPNNLTPVNFTFGSIPVPNTPIILNYYVKLACEACEEIRLLWPLVWMIPELFNRVNNKFSLPAPTLVNGVLTPATATLTVELLLHVISKKLIKDPAQANPTLNTGAPVNGPCICDTSSAATYDYTFNFTLEGPVTGTVAGLARVTDLQIIFSTPNNAAEQTIIVDVSGANPTFALAVPIIASPSVLNFFVANLVFTIGIDSVLTLPLAALLESIGVTIPADAVIGSTLVTAVPGITPGTVIVSFTTGGSPPEVITVTVPMEDIIGTIPVFSPAHYVSFVPSCDKDECDEFFVATNLGGINV